MKYEIDYGYGTAILYTENNDWKKRFFELAGTCFGIRKSIGYVKLINESEEDAPDKYPDEYERLEFGGKMADMYIWRKDGARKMVRPLDFADEEWDEDFVSEPSEQTYQEQKVVEKKCENCVFCTEKPKQLSFLPNDWICGCFMSKWFNYWPTTGVCEHYSEPTGRTVEEVLGERGKQAVEGMSMFLNAMWGNDSSIEHVKNFLQQDSAVIGKSEDFTECKK